MVASGEGRSSQTNDWNLNISVSLCTHVQFDHVTLTRADTGQRGRRLPAHPQANHTATSILLSPAKARLLIFLPQPPRFRLNKDHAECFAMFTDVWWLLAHYICSLNYSEMRAACMNAFCTCHQPQAQNAAGARKIFATSVLCYATRSGCCLLGEGYKTPSHNFHVCAPFYNES